MFKPTSMFNNHIVSRFDLRIYFKRIVPEKDGTEERLFSWVPIKYFLNIQNNISQTHSPLYILKNIFFIIYFHHHFLQNIFPKTYSVEYIAKHTYNPRELWLVMSEIDRETGDRKVSALPTLLGRNTLYLDNSQSSTQNKNQNQQQRCIINNKYLYLQHIYEHRTSESCI